MKTSPSLTLVAGLTALAWPLAACSGRPASSAAAAATPLTVAVAPVQLTNVTDTFEAGGVVEARTTAMITSRIVAPVREVRVAPGDRVRAGNVLVVLDGRDLDAHAESARASAAAAGETVVASAADARAADAALVLARASHARVADLYARRSATAQELDEATAALGAAEARAGAAAARVQAATASADGAGAAHEAARTAASFAVITAPFDGVVTEKLVEPGNLATPGAPLVRLEDTRGFRLDVRVDASRAGHVTPGGTVPVTFDAGIDGQTTSVTATVTDVSRAVDAGAHTVLVKLALPDSATARSGLFGRATFNGRPRRALTVPAEALVRRGQMTSAFIVDNGVARLRLVNAAGTEVLAGLAEGDLVVVNPTAALSDGRPVTTGGR